MAHVTINAPGASGFLYNSGSGTARICITAETEDFDKEILRSWRDEGFDVIYIPFDVGEKEYISRLKTVKGGLGVGENYAVVAFGEAASFCLDYYLKSTNASRLCALVAYYPTNIPDTRSRFPKSLRVLVHLAGSNVDMTTTPTALGLQGKRRRQTKRISPGIGTGERLNIGYPAYTYEYVQPGFAEYDLDEYDKLAADVAWTRSLGVLRKGFGKEVDLEKEWEEHQEGKFFSSNISAIMNPFADHVTPAATYTPTMSGGIGPNALQRFYRENFLGTLPPSMRLRLISRTIGADRVVDELYASFTHTHEIPWMLPGVPPTDKKIEIIIVSIASIKAGKLHSEHVYWDQASVLVQAGLLDPKLVPQDSQAIDRLPVVGKESARRILHEDTETDDVYHNKLIKKARAKKDKGSDRRNGKAPASVSMEEVTDDSQA